MSLRTTDIAIIGAGMAGASLAAFIAGRARVLMLEAEAQPGYHSTGRSAAFWAESYGGPLVQPLTTASGPWLRDAGVLSLRGCLHVATDDSQLDAIRAELSAGGVGWRALDRAALARIVPGLRPAYSHGIEEPSCSDIDVAALHARMFKDARAGHAELLCGAEVTGLAPNGSGWRLETRAGPIEAAIIVNAAGAWAGRIGALAGASAIPIQAYRRTIVQLVTEPTPPAGLPLVIDAEGSFYFKPEAGGRLWLSPHDETPVVAHDVAPEEIDQAVAIARLEQVVSWQVTRRELAWSGLRSFAPDRLPVYGFDAHAPGFFWCAGQGGFGIQTAPAAGMIAAALLLDAEMPAMVSGIDVARYAPDRFGYVAG